MPPRSADDGSDNFALLLDQVDQRTASPHIQPFAQRDLEQPTLKRRSATYQPGAQLVARNSCRGPQERQLAGPAMAVQLEQPHLSGIDRRIDLMELKPIGPISELAQVEHLSLKRAAACHPARIFTLMIVRPAVASIPRS